eukprot:CAMPEP_0113301714 /NCGR_PEP_ID=MMETSP0010_2-20120614/2823_1 /TAXON_ID=216773 ORGANISM="Corethron hystrix, Strain 308" /NCGR_SAMPLE_ID=MMETSP0010_2 /ASSEMBLY_ACC=CAM_ASM_000155 /LENGTH=274 /DNA_ID=CAMNT_0000155373 /DNA_START=663 /DNA_END=1487 /DNA_ORIENTATION=- /assembly_acc=CAM_ASM_000155
MVTWKVRCYHYDWRRKPVDGTKAGRSWEKRKVVTHTATRNYECDGRWTDASTVGVWERGLCEERTWRLGKPPSRPFVPYSKLSMSKALVLMDEEATADYYRQQSEFVMGEGRRDTLAEFSTAVDVEGFRPKVLVSHTVLGPKGTKIVRMHYFWIFTLLGLTIPYRIWFSRHCDELAISVIKHLYGKVQQKEKKSSQGWLSSFGNLACIWGKEVDQEKEKVIEVGILKAAEEAALMLLEAEQKEAEAHSKNSEEDIEMQTPKAKEKIETGTKDVK